MPAPKLLIAKKETTYGVDATPAATDVIRAENVVFTPRGDRSAADVAKPGVGPVAGQMTGVYGELSFNVPIVASGTAGTAPKWGGLMKACGMSETIVATTSVTYGLAADPSASDSMTFVWREGRRLHKLTGARGRVSAKLDENQRPMLNFAFKGLIVAVADGAQLAQADATWTGWSDQLPVVQGRTTFTFAGANPPLRSLSIDAPDNVVFSDRPGEKLVEILGARAFNGKLKCGTLLPSVLNFETLADNNTVSTFSVVHGATAGSIVTVNGRVQVGKPSYSDDKGKDVTDVDLGFVASALNTDDDWSLVLT